MSGEENKEKWNLYVLRYNYSGNYYVGTTIEFEDRMLDHWRRDSDSVYRLPKWSKKNESIKGFKFFWFNIEESGVSQGYAERCENQLAELLVEEIENINQEKLSREIHVGSGLGVDCNGYNHEFEPKASIDEKIEKYLKNLKRLKTKDGEFQIECYGIGCVAEYDNSLCKKSWEEVASIRFLSN